MSPQNGPVLSYSVTNDRGWNDPPSFAFSPNSTGNRKRIDPRKRVAHDISSMNNGFGSPTPVQAFQPVQSPAFQPVQPNSQASMNSGSYQNAYVPQVNGLSNGIQNMSLTPSKNSLQHANSNPDLHQMNMINNMPQPLMHHSTSVPGQINQSGQNRIPGHTLGNMTPPPSSCNTPPLVSQRSGSATPPPHAYIHDNTSNRKMSALSMPFANPSIFNQHSTPTMLQTSHLKPNDNSPVSTPATNRSPVTVQPMGLPPRISPMPPTAVPDHLNNHSFSNPETYHRPSPSPTNIPPPTMGYYSQRPPSGKNSPKSISPIASGRNSPSSARDSPLIENDNETLTNTINVLNNFKNKCSCNLTNKMSDDIAKKLNAFEMSWRSGKLSQNAKYKIVQLAQALNNNDLQSADKLHISLVREHSNEVSSWIIAIKKMLTTYQSAPTQ